MQVAAPIVVPPPVPPAVAPAAPAVSVSVDASQEAQLASTPFGRALLNRTRHLRQQHYVVDKFEVLSWECAVCESTYKVPKYRGHSPQDEYGAKLGSGHEHPDFCQSCLANWITAKLNDNCSDIRCVDSKCTTHLSAATMWGRLPHKLLRKWDRIRLMNSLKVMPDLRFCPVCETPSYLSNGCNEAQCPHCNFAFCPKCLLPPHSALRCSVAVHEQDPEVQKRFFEERLNVQWKAANTKPCPQCRSSIEKNDGCSHMTCKSCQYQFCWICLQKYVPGRAITGVEANGEKCRCPPPPSDAAVA